MEIQQKLLTINKYSRPGSKIGHIKKITVHWVGNAGSSAIANRNYFEGLKEGKKNAYGNYIYASSHYIVGLQGEVVLCIPEDELAYHGNSHNNMAIGIETCHPDWGGKFSELTYKSLVELVAELCTRYKLSPLVDVERHYDITKKDCPHYYVVNEQAWRAFLVDVKNKIEEGDEMLIKEKLNVNGKEIEVDSITKDGVTYIPMRQLANMLGAEVTYDNATKRKGLVVPARA
ncbi:N-acetylmuramoyl-L-alanine amidase [Cellulosilyticum sp. WCF-2]|uniref:N-acetylmuramoyl-L-alanine amidase n=1 Tax=Cellulosilyticum sp. WCF-2 TaxID=2497860 RepID=UPI000F8F1179|nr:N-acetylmuramoyl-L-alanine amidase [Cellulosilyticum sp. WCF-2]QEH67250.1 N-acetylmuramoyl-L-alanine amidase [Cellulosilyticum sp. WCF-2]QEH69903.1 N-acetylmuramoyl-L-alanine amidase [Cellulosilyticum sp. WCF-2]